MYELDGIEYTLEELEQAAVEQEMAFLLMLILHLLLI